LINRFTLALFSAVSLALLLSSCEEPIDGIGEITEAKLAISSNFFPNELVHVSVSSTFGRNQTAMNISNAQVNLYSNDNLIESLEYIPNADPGGASYYSTREFQPAINHRYTIRVDAPGFDQVVAVSSIPVPVQIRLFELEDLSQEPKIGADDVFALRVKIDYEDPAGFTNFYHLRIFQQYHKYALNTEQDTVIIDSHLRLVNFQESSQGYYKLVAQDNGGILIQDRPHDEYLSFIFRPRLNPEVELLGSLYAQLRTVSKEYYDFEHSISNGTGSSTGGSGVNPSVVVQGNVSNGFGIFAGYAFTSDSLIIGH
jgi:hypothetical protein